MKHVYVLLILLFASACSNQPDINNFSQNEQEAKETLAVQSKVLVENLNVPWDIEKSKNFFYLTQRDGSIVEYDLNTKRVQVQSLLLNKPINQQGEGGLLGFVLASDFLKSNQAFLYHTYKERNNIVNRVILVEKRGNQWVEINSLLEGIPGGVIHNGGRMKVGPDGYLYVTAGDAGEPGNAQKLESLAGKILRMNVDGSIPKENPFPNSYVYSYGHRNPQGLAWTEDQILYSTEHGQIGHDEINLIKPGANYGWPVIQGSEKRKNMETPIFHTGDETWAPSGISYDKGRLYIATLRDEKIRSFDLEDLSVEIVYEQGGRMRDVMVHDGEIYAITNNRDGRGVPRKGDDKFILLYND
ncbi:PQQ-dependent sugar dehydrogenase [Bacillus timonensis]|nr:PQQ-dependent sugar dehydrogenase [Bacillus timonensis]